MVASGVVRLPVDRRGSQSTRQGATGVPRWPWFEVLSRRHGPADHLEPALPQGESPGKGFGVQGVLVVSQGYHLPRAVTTCRAVGLDAEGVGDWTARSYPARWSAGERREKLAAAKTVVDLVTGRDPVLGPAETSVRDALAATSARS